MGSTWAGVHKFAAGTGGVCHVLGGALADTFRVSIASDAFGDDSNVAVVDFITNRLSNEVVGNGKAIELVCGEQGPFFVDGVIIGECGIDIEVISPTGEFDAIVAHFINFGQEFGE